MNQNSNLTKNIINELANNSNKKMEGTFQIIKIFEINSQNPKNKVLLSDGIYYTQLFIIDQKNEKFLQTVKLKSIIQADIIYVGKHQSNVILDFKLIQKDVNEIIGKPLEILPGKVLPNNFSSSTIPIKKQEVTDAIDQLFNQEPQITKLTSTKNIENKFFNKIADLNQYDRSFRIQGRIMDKSKLKEFQTKNNETGYVFSIIIKDQTRAIQASFFNKEAQKYYNVLQEKQIYSFSDGVLRQKSKYNKTNNKLELIFNEKSEIEKLQDSKEFDYYYFNLVKIGDIPKLEGNSFIDVIGIIDEIQEIREMKLKNGQFVKIRNIIIKDEENKVQLNLWKEEAEFLPFKINNIVLFQNVSINDYQGKKLNFSETSKMLTEIPNELARYKELMKWKIQFGSQKIILQNISEEGNFQKMKFLSIQEIIEQSQVLIQEEDPKPLFFNTFANLVQISEKLFYQACLNENCKKKVTEQSDGTFLCQKCDKIFDTFQPKFISSLTFSDGRTQIQINGMGAEVCDTIFEGTEKQIYDQMEKEKGCKRKL